MSLLVQPRLVNPPEGDPGLYLDFRFERRAILFDLGDLGGLSPRELLGVSHAFVSHAHMDHVAGFDRLLRLRLHRPRPLSIVGPDGFLRQTEHRLQAISWNLLDATSVDFRLTILEFDGERVTAAGEFRAQDGFHHRAVPPPALSPGRVLEEEPVVVEATALDHGGIPSLAFALQERLRVNVWRNGLDELDLPVGRWLDEAKRAVRAGQPDDHSVDVPGRGAVRLGDLRERVFRVARGQRVAYVTDAADTPENRRRIVGLASAADHLFIETSFLERDRSVADATAHLTAKAAGEIARAAGVTHVSGFHQSARYAGAPGALAAELSAAAGDLAGPLPGPAPARAGSTAPAAEAGWLRDWRTGGLTPAAALRCFDASPPIGLQEMLGTWRGRELPTGHPLDGLLESLGWSGKRFATADCVHPLLFGTRHSLDPARLPVRLALRLPRLAHSAVACAAFGLLRPMLATRAPTARLRLMEFRGSFSAAMIYDRQPIIDHFRRIDAARVLGLMEMRAAPPYFFYLVRAPQRLQHRVGTTGGSGRSVSAPGS